MNDSTIKVSMAMQEMARNVDARVKSITGERMGFVLVVFTDGRASYVSNCDRAEIIKEFKHMLELWEQDMPDVPAHEVN